MSVLTGFHSIEERIKKSPKDIEALLVAEAGPRVKNIMQLAEKSRIAIRRVSSAELDKLAKDNRGAVLVTRDTQASTETDFYTWIEAVPETPQLVLLLDHIEDPHNLGAILRSCDVFAVSLVVLPNKRSAHTTDTVHKVSAGAAAYVPIAEVANLRDAAARLKDAGFWIYGADMSGTSLTQGTFAKHTALIMGTEGKGLSPILRKECDEIISIPQYGHIDSLNVSVATGIFLYEIACRHQHRP